ncbi:MAG: Ig-like domain-containing protein, partial [Acidimicrobiales bacterium]
MGQHRQHSSNHHRYLLTAVAAAVVVLGTGGVAFAVLSGASTGLGGGRSAAGAPRATTTTTPPPPLVVSTSSPTNGATAVVGTQPVTFTTTAKVDLTAQQPTISPAVPGSWASTATQLTFTPTGAFPAQTKVTVTLPAGLASTEGAQLATAQTLSFTTADGSLLRAQQVLAKLGYLPLSWTPTTPLTTDAQRQQAVYNAPPGNFAWTWTSPPPTLVSQWTPGVASPMTKGAVMAFESDHSLATDGIVGTQVWAALLSATSTPNPTLNPHG